MSELSAEKTEELIEKAISMLKISYAPYSKYHVGASLLAKNGKIYTGCNIENIAFGPSNCAERTAFFKAISEGVREFEAIAIAGGHLGEIQDYCPPCGVCRQVMREFCNDDFKIILIKSENQHKILTLKEILPESFKPEGQIG